MPAQPSTAQQRRRRAAMADDEQMPEEHTLADVVDALREWEGIAVAVLIGVGLFLLIAAPNFVPLFFMDQQLEILRMGIESGSVGK